MIGPFKQVVGTDLSAKSTSVYDVPLEAPTVLVLGNEGHGIRTNILRRCTHLVRIGDIKESGVASSSTPCTSAEIREGIAEHPAATGESMAEGEGGVDSLNVSVTGAIILHHFMTGRKR
jgi:hypothetical protein